MVDIFKTKIDDLELFFPPYYGDDKEEEFYNEYPVDVDYIIDETNDYIKEKLYDVDLSSGFHIEFKRSNLHNHYDAMYVRATAGYVNETITLWEYIYMVIAIDDIYDSVESYESDYSDLVYETLKRIRDIDAAFDIIEDEVRINKIYKYDEHKQWFENDFVYRRDLCKRSVAVLDDIFKYVDEMNENISESVA